MNASLWADGRAADAGADRWDVVFRYADDDAQDGDDDWAQREQFATRAEAEAFASGLTYGDEPQYEVDEIVACTLEDDR